MEDLLKIYDREVRANPVYPDIVQVIRTRHIVKLEGPFDFICYWDIPKGKASQIVHEEVAYYKNNKKQLMWRFFDHDKPSNLEKTLKDEGLKIVDSVTLMVLAVDDSKYEVCEHDIREIKEYSELYDFLSVTEAAFGEPSPNDFEHLSSLLSVSNFKYYVGYSNNVPVAAARFEIPIKSRFGLLFGGCVVPSL